MKRNRRSTFSPELRAFVIDLPVAQQERDWYYIDIPLDFRMGFDAMVAKYSKAAHNYRRIRDDHATTRLDIYYSTVDAPHKHFRLWLKISKG
jgi:hypothetical protein